MKVALVVKDDIRHRVFLNLANNKLGGEHDLWVFMHSLDLPGVGRSRFWHWIIRLIRRARGLYRRASGRYAIDLQMKANEGLDPLSDAEIPKLFKTSNLNDGGALSRLCDLNPDLVLIFGAPILRDDWITVPRLGALNMHYGALPWYRSGYSTQFALLHERPDRIGATVHYIDSGIDTGGIVKRYPVSPHKFSSVSELIAAVYSIGAHGIIECAKKSLLENAKLQNEVEVVDGSFYPAKLGTASVMSGAAWRFDELSRPWPYAEETVEQRSLHRPRIWQYRIPRAVPGGVYIFLYHGLTDPHHMKPWERSYGRVATQTKNFFEQVELLLNEGFVPIALTDAPEVLRQGASGKRYFVITFDDAYSNIHSASEFLSSYRMRPTVFANGAFCSGVGYFRVLAAMLRDHRDGSRMLHAELKARVPSIQWSQDPKTLFNQTKDNYINGITEEAVAAAFEAVIGDPKRIGCHLTAEGLRELEKEGWQVGNHTWAHRTLSALPEQEVRNAIERNDCFLKESLQCPVSWLAYPNGLARHVNAAVKKWLDERTDYFGAFAGGGVNLMYSRTQWMRISIADPILDEFRRQIRQSVDASINGFGHRPGYDTAKRCRI
jgi:peptidoglycan/xylan/chitin deacetylase (PgdA/CDA1 family)/folate-dependent phosphoribosylglycinamide formyltransferase PurN